MKTKKPNEWKVKKKMLIEVLAKWRWQTNKMIVEKVESQCEKCKRNLTKIPDWENICDEAKQSQRDIAEKMLAEVEKQ